MKIALISTNQRFIDNGLRSISAYLRENGSETKMIFMPTSNFYENKNYSYKNLSDLFSLVKDCQIIGFSCMSPSYDRTVQVIRYLKGKMGGFFIWGGIHATLLPESCIDEVDAVGIGEGEEAFFELATLIKNNQNYLQTKNFWFNYEGKTIKNPIRPLLENLDLLPFPDYDLETQYILHNEIFVPANKFFEENFWQLYSGRILIHTARGCPYNCTYCSNSALNKLYKDKGPIIRKRSIDKIIGEIKYLLTRFPEAKKVFIDDDVFPIRTKDELIYFCREYKKSINIPFECYFTPKFVDEEIFKLLIDAGLDCVLMGVQTGSERINKNIYKRYFSNKMVLDASKIITKYKTKLRPTAYQFIISNPYEEEEDIIATIDLLQNISPPFNASIFNLIYFPGTEMREMVEKDNIYKDINKKSSNQISDDLEHIKYEEKYPYLNSLLRCMGGWSNEKRIGFIPRSFINPLLKLNRSKFKFIGYIFIISIVYLKGFRNRSYFKLMPLFPKSIQNFILRKIRKEY